MATPKPTPKPNGKATAKPSTASLKKSGIAKLTALGKTTSEAHIISAVRQGKITKYEAAAIDPKNFKSMLAPAVSSKTVNLKTPRGSGGMPRGGSLGSIGGGGMNWDTK